MLYGDNERARRFGLTGFSDRAILVMTGMTMASDGRALTGLWLEGQKYCEMTLDPEHTEKELPVFAETRRWLDLCFSGQVPDLRPPLCLKGAAFRAAGQT